MSSFTICMALTTFLAQCPIRILAAVSLGILIWFQMRGKMHPMFPSPVRSLLAGFHTLPYYFKEHSTYKQISSGFYSERILYIKRFLYQLR